MSNSLEMAGTISIIWYEGVGTKGSEILLKSTSKEIIFGWCMKNNKTEIKLSVP